MPSALTQKSLQLLYVVHDSNQEIQLEAGQYEYAFVLEISPPAPTQVRLRLKREKLSHSRLLLLIRLANQLVQQSKPPFSSLRVV